MAEQDDRPIYLLIESLAKQTQACLDAQETMRLYFSNQIDSLRKDFATKERLQSIEDDVRGLQTTVSKFENRLETMEDNILSKIDQVSKKQDDRQKESYRKIIAVQSSVLLAIAGTVISILASFFHK
jgi:Mg2+ and Co2+ transporter CorA